MKRTVEITTRYQPVIDFYKGYNNAEFNVLTNNLLCNYKLLKQEKNLDLLMLIEYLKGYSITLPELMTLISQNFENISPDKIKEIEMSNINNNVVDILNAPKAKKIKKQSIKKSTNIEQEQAIDNSAHVNQMMQQPMYQNQSPQFAYQQIPQGYQQVQGYPPIYTNSQQMVQPPVVIQQIPLPQPVNKNVEQQIKHISINEDKNIAPKNRKFNILDVGIDLSD